LQPWYADDVALRGPASHAAELFHLLCRHGPSIGYFPEPEKCWVICPLSTELQACQVFDDASLPMSYCCGHRYVGRFVSSRVTQDEWLSPIIQKWVTGIERLAAIATRFPHSTYAGIVSCLSAEWQYTCRTVPDVGPSLTPVENTLRTKFLPAILGADSPIDNELRTLLAVESRLEDWLSGTPPSLPPPSTPHLLRQWICWLVPSSAMSPLTSRHTKAVSALQERHIGEPNMTAKLPSTQPSWTGCRRRSRNGWSMSPPSEHCCRPSRTGSLAWNSPRTSGLTASPSNIDGDPPTSPTNATAVLLASCWSTDSTAKEADLLAFATMTCVMNGPTFAALPSPTHES
ncbi:hypothetical protein ACHAW6_004634, partial [Cyclotella cf. meneghiniana]